MRHARKQLEYHLPPWYPPCRASLTGRITRRRAALLTLA